MSKETNEHTTTHELPRLRVGLTGGIASGKTTVANRLSDLGAGIIDTDLIAREVVKKDSEGLRRIVDEFGTGILLGDGGLHRKQLRKLIFSDAGNKARLDAILHPLIRTQTLRQIQDTQGPYVVIVVPLLFESKFDELVDRVLVVDCPESDQIQRLIDRDDETTASARQAIASQIDRKQRLAGADDVIENTGTLDELIAAADELHQRYLGLTRSTD